MKYQNAVEKNKEIIYKAQDYIWANPETGYREVKTSHYMQQEFEKLGYDLVLAENIPGFYTVIDTGRPGPDVLILGELDALICFEHPDADKVTGAVHNCGHSAQCAALLGVAAALKEPGVLDDLCGKIRLCAVPAEELIEIEYRTQLRNEGKIKYFGGKTEFLHRGYFDGVDIAFMIHTGNSNGLMTRLGSVGCMAKRVIYKGTSSHAGSAPWNGCNALYAATQGLSAINAIRETFKEPDIIRVHPIITKGGGAVNAIPDRVIIESYIRGSSYDAIIEANKKVNKALCGAALSLGANIEIQDNPGYAPLHNSEGMMQLAEEATGRLDGVPFERINVMGSGSTDMGDLSGLMPVIHPYMGGAIGIGHGSNYFIANPDLACVGSAKLQMEMLAILLENNAKRAYEIIDEFEPMYESKEAYLNMIESLIDSGDRIDYTDEKSAVIRL